ncbi:glycosyltransferase family 4 protein [Candidatus Bipolaricaulota bacterium]|nr:glycosyltransferase family 4 protein [Candidatus Bipolaricaulota bacterium]
MRVCLYLEAPELLSRSGIYSAFRNHLEALRIAGVEVTTDPKDRYDLLHLHWFGPKSLRYLRRAKRRGIPVVLHAHSIGRYDFAGGFTGTSLVAPLYERFLDRVYRKADALFVPSGFAKQMLSERGLGPAFVVSNGIDLSRFRFSEEKRKTWRKRLGLGRFTVYCSGNILPRKGVVDFIEVARALPELAFVWFGQHWGPWGFNPRMNRALKRRPQNLLFPGFVREPEGAYAACDLFFFPTYGETQSLVVLEAAALGRPLVLRDVPAFSELVHGVQCLKGAGVEEFIEHIKRVAEEPACRLALSREAYRWAMGHGLPEVGRRLLSLYRTILEGGAAVETAAEWG